MGRRLRKKSADRHKSIVAALIAGFCAVFPARDAFARKKTYRLAWDTEASAHTCQGAAQRVEKATRTRLGFDPFAIDAVNTVEAHLSRSASGHRVVLAFVGEGGARHGTRQLESASQDCATVLEAASLAISLAIREEADREPEPPTPPRPASPPTPRRARVAVPPTPPPAVIPRREGRLGASLVASVGAAPGLAFGLDVSGRMTVYRNISVSLGLLHLPEVEARDSRFKIGLTLARAGTCIDPFQRRGFEISSCVHLAVGGTRAVVEQLAPRSPDSSFFFGAGIGEWIFVRPSRGVAIGLGEELTASVPRYRLFVEGSNRTIFTMTPVTAFTFFGIALTTD